MLTETVWSGMAKTLGYGVRQRTISGDRCTAKSLVATAYFDGLQTRVPSDGNRHPGAPPALPTSETHRQHQVRNSQILMNVVPILNSRAILGECPVWRAADRRLYWLDIFGQTLNCLNPTTATNIQITLSERVNSFAFRSGGGLVAACWNGFGTVDASSGNVDRFHDLRKTQPGFFLNDGRCDRRGRFWAGSACENFDVREATLFRLTADRTILEAAKGSLISNGLAFSPDDKRAYYADTFEGVIWIYDFDLDDGVLSNRREFARCPFPDGAAVDTLGRYWVACFGQSEVRCFTPSGVLDQVIKLPTSQVTMCAFGGDSLDTLFITTGTFWLDPVAVKTQTLAGAVFAVTGLGAQGLPEPEFQD